MTRGTGQQTGVTRADVPFALLAVASGLLLLYLGRSLTFLNDEWSFIRFNGGLTDYLRPHNEHWSTLPLLLYRATFRIIELRSYLPYLTELIVLHLLAVAGAYALMRARVGPVVATMLAVPLLLLGAGAENLFWAFQTGFVGSVMFGVWALWFIERDGRVAPVVASALLVAGLASSGMGLFFLVAVAARTALEPSLRRRALAVVPPLAVYLVWFVLAGRDAVGDTGRVVVDQSAARFVVRGITFATERFFGFHLLPEGYLWGLLLFIGVAAVTGLRIVRGRQRPVLAFGCLLGLVSMYALIAVARASLEFDYTNASRYVYVAGFFLALAVADLVPRRASWSLFARRAGVAAAAVLAIGLGLSIAGNVDELGFHRTVHQDKADVTRAFIGLAAAHGDEPWVDTRAQLAGMPSVPELLDIVSQHGSPVEDQLIPRAVTPPAARAQEAALLTMVGDGFRVAPADGSGAHFPLKVVNATGQVASAAGNCFRTRASADDAKLTFAAPGGGRIRMSSSSGINGLVRLGHDRPPSRAIDLDLEPRLARDLLVPDIGDGRWWQVAVELPGASALTLCGLR